MKYSITILVRAAGNWHRPFGPTDFLTIYGFRRLAQRVRA